MQRARGRRAASLALVLLVGWAARPVAALDFVPVDVAGNPPDTNGLGSVPAPFRIGRTEVTNADYVDLLNAVAADDPNGLFDDLMTDSDRGGILRAGTPGAWAYALKPDFADKPVNAVTWLDAARYCNWLHAGRPVGAQDASTTESGAYDLSVLPADVVRSPGALFYLPTIDEWYAAAYHDPFDAGADAGGSLDYWEYPTRSDSAPELAEADAVGDVLNPGANVANLAGGASWNGENGNVTTVGGAGASSAWGAFDLAGNVGEWTETPGNPIAPDLPTRLAPGGDFANDEILASSNLADAVAVNMQAPSANFGFRVAATACTLPGPATGLRVARSGLDVHLAWDEPGDADSWNVYRDAAPDPSAWDAPHRAGVTDRDGGRPGVQDIDVGAVDGEPGHHYLVSATNACGESSLR